MVAIIEVGGLQLWEWVQGLEEVAQWETINWVVVLFFGTV
jgi:hypothetical protein